jgi:hypothetical protein
MVSGTPGVINPVPVPKSPLSDASQMTVRALPTPLLLREHSMVTECRSSGKACYVFSSKSPTQSTHQEFESRDARMASLCASSEHHGTKLVLEEVPRDLLPDADPALFWPQDAL